MFKRVSYLLSILLMPLVFGLSTVSNLEKTNMQKERIVPLSQTVIYSIVPEYNFETHEEIINYELVSSKETPPTDLNIKLNKDNNVYDEKILGASDWNKIDDKELYYSEGSLSIKEMIEENIWIDDIFFNIYNDEGTINEYRRFSLNTYQPIDFDLWNQSATRKNINNVDWDYDIDPETTENKDKLMPDGTVVKPKPWEGQDDGLIEDTLDTQLKIVAKFAKDKEEELVPDWLDEEGSTIMSGHVSRHVERLGFYYHNTIDSTKPEYIKINSRPTGYSPMPEFVKGQYWHADITPLEQIYDDPSTEADWENNLIVSDTVLNGYYFNEYYEYGNDFQYAGKYGLNTNELITNDSGMEVGTILTMMVGPTLITLFFVVSIIVALTKLSIYKYKELR